MRLPWRKDEGLGGAARLPAPIRSAQDAIGLGPRVDPILRNRQHTAPVNGNGHQEATDAPSPSLFAWAAVMAKAPVKPEGRRRPAQAATRSLGAWALHQERTGEPAGAA